MRKPNDIGVAWKKTNNIGEYLSIALDIEALMALTGGQFGEKINFNAYPIVSDNPKAPDYQLKYYPPASSGSVRRPDPRERGTQRPPDDDDDIAF